MNWKGFNIIMALFALIMGILYDEWGEQMYSITSYALCVFATMLAFKRCIKWLSGEYTYADKPKESYKKYDDYTTYNETLYEPQTNKTRTTVSTHRPSTNKIITVDDVTALCLPSHNVVEFCGEKEIKYVSQRKDKTDSFTSKFKISKRHNKMIDGPNSKPNTEDTTNNSDSTLQPSTMEIMMINNSPVLDDKKKIIYDAILKVIESTKFTNYQKNQMIHSISYVDICLGGIIIYIDDLYLSLCAMTEDTINKNAIIENIKKDLNDNEIPIFFKKKQDVTLYRYHHKMR
jgi:hypothetical protein